jgi:hypothetical protein
MNALEGRTGTPQLPPLTAEALRRAIEPIRERILTLCKTAEAEKTADPKHADGVGRRLLEQTKPPLTVLDTLLPQNHPSCEHAHDEVALCVLGCMVAFGNAVADWKIIVKIVRQAFSVAASESARARLKENLKVAEGNLELATCWFCKTRPADDASAVEVEMYGEVTRTPTALGINVQWRHTKIKVPRCTECKSGHTSVIRALFGRDVRPESEKTKFPAVEQLKAQGWAFGSKPPGVQ